MVTTQDLLTRINGLESRSIFYSILKQILGIDFIIDQNGIVSGNSQNADYNSIPSILLANKTYHIKEGNYDLTENITCQKGCRLIGIDNKRNINIQCNNFKFIFSITSNVLISTSPTTFTSNSNIIDFAGGSLSSFITIDDTAFYFCFGGNNNFDFVGFTTPLLSVNSNTQIEVSEYLDFPTGNYLRPLYADRIANLNYGCSFSNLTIKKNLTGYMLDLTNSKDMLFENIDFNGQNLSGLVETGLSDNIKFKECNIIDLLHTNQCIKLNPLSLNVSFEKCLIEHCRSTTDSPFRLVENLKFKMVECKIIGCKAGSGTFGAGGIFINSSPMSLIQSNSFNYCDGSGSGGGICSINVSMNNYSRIYDNEVYQCFAPTNGSSIYVSTANRDMIHDNHFSTTRGGGSNISIGTINDPQDNEIF